MSYQAEILTDSINESEQRLTTFEITFPRMVLAEFNTHRMLSRNSASSRAIPVEKQLIAVLNDPFIPTYWGANIPGMQAEREVSEKDQEKAEGIWLRSRDSSVFAAVALIGGLSSLKNEKLQQQVAELPIPNSKSRIKRIVQRQILTKLIEPLLKVSGLQIPGYNDSELGEPIHKQIANRLLEPFMWHTVITTGTDWSNFSALRANKQAQPEIQKIAYMMKDLYSQNQPRLLEDEQWHLPLIQEDERELPIEDLRKMAVGRCARVSYLTHDTGVRDPKKDIELHDSLLSSRHMSPFEHVARPMNELEVVDSNGYSGNFHGWHQYRKDIPGESDFSLLIEND